MPALGTWTFLLTFSGQGIRNLVGWWAFGLIAAVSGIVLMAAFLWEGHRVPRRALPPTACAYTGLCLASVLWSHYRGETVLAGLLMLATTTAGVLLACSLSLRQLTDALSRALEATLVLSLLLELHVALILRKPLIPVYMEDWPVVPPSYVWVEGKILQGGPIQGIVGNRNPLAFIALLTLLCVAVRWRDHRLKWTNMLVWAGLSVLVLALTDSATVVVATVVCTVVMIFLWLLRHVPVSRRPAVLLAASTLGVAVVALAVGWHSQLTALLGRSADMTGRWEIWTKVLALWEQHTLLGWGWIMYWVPWIPMFATLVIRPDGTPTLSAHNAYVEALLQTGVVGAALVVVLVLRLLYHSYRLAVRYVDSDPSVLLPALVSTAMVVQSLTESRLLSEGNWLTVCAMGTWFGLHRLVERERDDPWALERSIERGERNSSRARTGRQNGRQSSAGAVASGSGAA